MWWAELVFDLSSCPHSSYWTHATWLLITMQFNHETGAVRVKRVFHSQSLMVQLTTVFFFDQKLQHLEVGSGYVENSGTLR